VLNMFDLNDDEDKTFDYYTVEKGDSLYSISKKYNVNPKLLAALNGLNSSDYIYPNQVIILPSRNYNYYITKDGDTLKLVSDAFGTSEQDLIKDNGTIYLQEGQLIVNKISN